MVPDTTPPEWEPTEFEQRVMADTFEGIGALALLNKREDESGYGEDAEGAERAIGEMIHIERAVKAAGYRIMKLREIQPPAGTFYIVEEL